MEASASLINVKNNKYDIVHRSDNTLNTREKVVRNEALYKSSSELTSLPVEHDQVTKVKVVEQNLEIPNHVKMNVYDNLILSNTVKVPKRPERN